MYVKIHSSKKDNNRGSCRDLIDYLEKENIEKGIPADLETLKKEIAERDYKDSHREVSPLRPAEDAITFDTTGVSIDGVVEFIQEKAKKIIDKG